MVGHRRTDSCRTEFKLCPVRIPRIWKEPDGKNAESKSSENFAEEKMFAEDISEDFSEDRKYHFYWILKYFWTSSKSLRKIAFFWEVLGNVYPLGAYP